MSCFAYYQFYTTLTASHIDVTIFVQLVPTFRKQFPNILVIVYRCRIIPSVKICTCRIYRLVFIFKASSRRLSSESALMSSQEKLKHSRKGSRKLKLSDSNASSICSNLNKIGGPNDLTKMLLTDDYFSDVNPRSMRRLFNVVYVTGDWQIDWEIAIVFLIFILQVVCWKLSKSILIGIGWLRGSISRSNGLLGLHGYCITSKCMKILWMKVLLWKLSMKSKWLQLFLQFYNVVGKKWFTQRNYSLFFKISKWITFWPCSLYILS